LNSVLKLKLVKQQVKEQVQLAIDAGLSPVERAGADP